MKRVIEIRGLCGDGVIGQLYNLAFEYEDTLRKLLSFQVRADGSIILIDKIPYRGEHRTKTILAARKGQKAIHHNDMSLTEFNDASVVGKMTFHPSGIVNLNNHSRVVRPSLKTMDVTQQLCTIIYPHLTELEVKNAQKANDFVVFASVPSNTHLSVMALVSPPSCVLLKEFISPSTLGYVEATFKGPSMAHSEGSYILHLIVSVASCDNQKRANAIFMITESDQTTPPNLKPKF